MIINHDYLLDHVEGVIDNNDNGDDDTFGARRYENTKQTNWMMHTEGSLGREVQLIPFGSDDDEFWPKVMREELMAMYDNNVNLLFHKSVMWMVPKFGNDDIVLRYDGCKDAQLHAGNHKNDKLDPNFFLSGR